MGREPALYAEAMRSADAEAWKEACQYEIDALAKNETWDLVDLPAGRKAVKSKWVFKLKSDGRFRARVVAKGFTQVPGIDFDETFSPVARFESLRLLLALAVLAAGPDRDRVRHVDPILRTSREMSIEEAFEASSGQLVLITRRLGGAGFDPGTFGFRWFLPSLLRYRRPLAQVVVASLFVQLFALVTPIFFQLVVDKVLVHKGLSTLVVLVVGLATLGLFEAILQFLRAYTLNHTTNRIDVELGRRLFHHLFHLPLSYFETRAAGQTVARVRELETIRSFLTGQGLTSLLDLVFTIVFFVVLFIYSVKLTLVIIASIPVYLIIAALLRPILRQQINEKFNRGARSQQFLVESIVGAQTLKAASVEPIMQAQWEERLAAYVRTSFDASVTGSFGQNLIQYVSKATTALVLFLGAQSVIDGSMTVGELIAFNMIAAQVVQPILRLSQLWQDFQQVQVSVSRLGDILNMPTEPTPQNLLTLPPPRGSIEFKGVTMRYRPDAAEALRDVSLSIQPGEVIGFVGQSGSGKSTLTKLVQRLYGPQSGQVMLDGVDIAQLDPGWLRRQIGVVLQENVLFNRTIHENIALGDPAMPRAAVMHAARLAGADEFVAQLPQGYDTMVEERGANLSGGQRQRLGDRPRPRLQSAHPDLRRGDLGARLRKRARRAGKHARHRARPDRAHHRAPARGATPMWAHRRHGPRRDRRDRIARGIAPPRERAVRPALGAAVGSSEGDHVNKSVAPPTAPRSPPQARGSAVSGRDREFLPAALEILETPPSPAPVAFMLAICAFFAAALVWSYFGRLDVLAVAPGKIESIGHAKVIQTLEPGKIAAIDVETGQAVKAGDVLVELDPTEALADQRSAADDLDAASAEAARRRYAIEALVPIQTALAAAAMEDPAPSLTPILAGAKDGIGWDAALPEEFRLRELAVLGGDIDQLTTQLQSLDKQAAQKTATRQRLNMSIAFEKQLIGTLNSRVGTRQEALDKQVGTKIDLYEAEAELQKAQAALASDQGELIENDAALREIASEKAKAASQFVADNENKLADAGRKADEAREALNKATSRLKRTKLVSPIDGVVQKLAATTLGQVFTTGQQVLIVSPNAGDLRVEALVANADIGFIKLGQDVAVKVDAFPFTRFGTLHGKLIGIAPEAVDEQEAKRAFANAAASANDVNSPAPEAQGQAQSFVFPVTIALDETAMPVGGARIPLSPGMTVTAEVRTDSRRIIDYLLSPLSKMGSEALHER